MLKGAVNLWQLQATNLSHTDWKISKSSRL